MATAIESPNLKILHVLTLNGRNGEYGGPVRVAREICRELNLRGHAAGIFSGAVRGLEPLVMPGLVENFVLVKPLLRRFPFSSLWSWPLFSLLAKSVKNSDIVHIHFARDLIPFLAAIISILYRKPFVTQTHGMIISDGRMSTQIVDILITRPLLNKSHTNFVLTAQEYSNVKDLKITTVLHILPNGIFVGSEAYPEKYLKNRFAFCSRLEKRKGVEKFIELADHYKGSGITFDIYGPDGGELDAVQKRIESADLMGVLAYKGSLPSHRVQEVLKDIDLVILPSKDEPFPMIILEALAVGASVLVMPSCGIASELRKFRNWFVSNTEDLDGLINSVNEFISKSTVDDRHANREFCRLQFSIENICSQLESVYFDSFSKVSGRT